MNDQTQTRYTAFNDSRCIARGTLNQVVVEVKKFFDGAPIEQVLVFEDATCHLVDIDFRATASGMDGCFTDTQPSDAAANTALVPQTDAPRGPGRPKLGVIAREVTLLPRHWEWLNSHSGGASVALRKLVEAARRANSANDRIRLAQEASYRFMSATLSYEANYEEVARALFAGQRDRFDQLVHSWPGDLRDYLKGRAEHAFQNEGNCEP